MSDGSNVFPITNSPKQAQIELVITKIRSRLAAACLKEAKIAHLDMQAQKLSCDAAIGYFANHAAIIAECVRRNLSLEGAGGRRRAVDAAHTAVAQTGLDEYKSKRLKYDGDDFGFRLACRLAGIPIDPPADSVDETGRHGETDGSGDEPNDGDADEQHETPDWLFDMLDRLLRFTVDAAATPRTPRSKKTFSQRR